MSPGIEERLTILRSYGVHIVDPRQTYIDETVDLARISPGTILYPGTRLMGSRTFLGPQARVGTEGPATLVDASLGEDAEVASGYVEGAVLLRGARLGSNAHVRAGTLLEEEASTAHAVGVKQTILLSYVTLGSLINFCDGLVCGGTSRQNHSEIGSGFIHFNFTPKGASGDKATPSLVGDVPRGVFLRERRIFLGGLSGMVGPQTVGFGALAVAGQVIRQAIAENELHGEVPIRTSREFSPGYQGSSYGAKIIKNIRYMKQLFALQAWYEEVRLARIPAKPDHRHLQIVTEEAIRIISDCIAERRSRLEQFAAEVKAAIPSLSPPARGLCPFKIVAELPYMEHTQWVKSLSDREVSDGIRWLQGIAG